MYQLWGCANVKFVILFLRNPRTLLHPGIFFLVFLAVVCMKHLFPLLYFLAACRCLFPLKN